MQRKKLKQNEQLKKQLEKQRQAAEAEAQRRAITSITQGYGGADDRRDATGPTAAGAGMGVGGGYASDYGFLKDGGLATMFVEKR